MAKAKKTIQTVGCVFGTSSYDKVYSYRLHESLIGEVKVNDYVIVQTGHSSGIGVARIVEIPAPSPERATAWAFQKVDMPLSKSLPRD
jgi:hypothetical protein